MQVCDATWACLMHHKASSKKGWSPVDFLRLSVNAKARKFNFLAVSFVRFMLSQATIRRTDTKDTISAPSQVRGKTCKIKIQNSIPGCALAQSGRNMISFSFALPWASCCSSCILSFVVEKRIVHDGDNPRQCAQCAVLCPVNIIAEKC